MLQPFLSGPIFQIFFKYLEMSQKSYLDSINMTDFKKVWDSFCFVCCFILYLTVVSLELTGLQRGMNIKWFEVLLNQEPDRTLLHLNPYMFCTRWIRYEMAGNAYGDKETQNNHTVTKQTSGGNWYISVTELLHVNRISAFCQFETKTNHVPPTSYFHFSLINYSL